VSELDTLEILANEYEELEKEREAFAQEKKLSRTKSAAQRKSRAKDAMNQATRETENVQGSPPHQVQRQQATEQPRGGPWSPPQQQ